MIPKREVTAAATTALKNICSVVRNPEIASLVPLLIESITKGGEHTKRALTALINTSFTNVVDVPSLALVIPILTGALSGRSSQTKKFLAACARSSPSRAPSCPTSPSRAPSCPTSPSRLGAGHPLA